MLENQTKRSLTLWCCDTDSGYRRVSCSKSMMSSSNRRLGVVQASVSDDDGDNDSTKLSSSCGFENSFTMF